MSFKGKAAMTNDDNDVFFFKSSFTATLLTSGMVSVRSGVFGWNKKDAPKLHW